MPPRGQKGINVSNADEVKKTWCMAGDHHVTMRQPRAHPCNGQCPWLVANHGTAVELYYDHEVPGIGLPEGDFDFAPWKRAQVWENDRKDGVHAFGSLCHVRMKGTELRAGDSWDVVSHQCTGAHVMQQRELLRHVEHWASALTATGAARLASEMLGRDVAEDELSHLALGELLARAHPGLLDPAIGSSAVAPPLTTGEIARWERLRVAGAADEDATVPARSGRVEDAIVHTHDRAT